MNWPLFTPVRPGDRLNADIAHLNGQSADLQRQVSDLRRRLQTAERAAEHAESSLAISREAHVVQLAHIAQLERIVASLRHSATHTPHWPIGRWLRFGPMADQLTNSKDRT